jgi:lipid-A-disaccharide synthase
VKYYIIAGEASGDLHASHLMREIKKLDPSAQFRCWGGDKMKEEGGELVKHYRDLAFMGFAEVIKHLPAIFRNLSFCKKDILRFRPDALIHVDYPGFNLRIAKWARSQPLFNKDGSKIIYYISPQVWAWKENRVKTMKECIDKMIVILPFEKDYYKKKWNWDVEYVGHPLIEVIQAHKAQATRKEQGTSSKRVVALLPGSRRQEIMKKLPVMLEVSKAFPDHQFIVAKAPSIEDSFYDSLMKEYENVSAVSGQTYDLLLKADAALVTSGTATLEAALFGVPEVVCYRGSYFSYQLGKRLVKVKFISLVNLIMDKMVVTELIQNDFNPASLENELRKILFDEAKRQSIQKDYTALRAKLKLPGLVSASANAGRSIIQFLSRK